MELFSFTHQKKDGIFLYLNKEELQYWFHFASFQTHWRGNALAENQSLTLQERQELKTEYHIFDHFLQRLLIYFPSNNEKSLKAPSLFVDRSLLLAIDQELEDYMAYCEMVEEKSLITKSGDYKELFSDVLEEQDVKSKKQ